MLRSWRSPSSVGTETELTTAMLAMSASSSPFGTNRPTSKVPAIRVSVSVFEYVVRSTLTVGSDVDACALDHPAIYGEQSGTDAKL